MNVQIEVEISKKLSNPMYDHCKKIITICISENAWKVPQHPQTSHCTPRSTALWKESIVFLPSGSCPVHCWCYKHSQNEQVLKKRNNFIFQPNESLPHLLRIMKHWNKLLTKDSRTIFHPRPTVGRTKGQDNHSIQCHIQSNHGKPSTKWAPEIEKILVLPRSSLQCGEWDQHRSRHAREPMI